MPQQAVEGLLLWKREWRSGGTLPRGGRIRRGDTCRFSGERARRLRELKCRLVYGHRVVRVTHCRGNSPGLARAHILDVSRPARLP
jgi:hypothetical protein